MVTRFTPISGDGWPVDATFQLAQGRDGASEQRGVWPRSKTGQRPRVGATYRVAVWSRLDGATLLGFLALSTGWFVPFISPNSRVVGLDSIALMAVIVGAIYTLSILRFGGWVRIDEHGLRSLRRQPTDLVRPELRLARDQIECFAARRWYARYDPTTGTGATQAPFRRWLAAEAVSVQTTDGIWAEVCARGRWWWRPVLLERRCGSWRWRVARTPEGKPLIWTAASDQLVADLFNERLRAVRAGAGSSSPPDVNVATPELTGTATRVVFHWIDLHRRTTPLRAFQRGAYSEALDGSDPPVPPPIPEPRLPDPTLPSAEELRAATVGVHLPCGFWSLASLRAGAMFGRRSSMTITPTEVHFNRRWRRDLRIPIAETREFVVVFHHASGSPDRPSDENYPGNWRVLLETTSGERHPLSGLAHGHFKQNRLYWGPSPVPRRASRDSRGSMPWPNDQPLLVAARLNAHLDAARSISPGTRSTIAPLAPRRSSR